MDVISAIENRRAVKAYDPSYRMPAEQREQLLKLAMLSPTSFNIQNWRFVVIEDPALRGEIRKVAWDQAQITDAPLLLVLCADRGAWHKQPERYWREAPQAAQDYLLPAIHNYFNGREQLQRDEGMRSCGIAAQTLMLAAKSMGYDSCPIGGFDFDAVGKLINLPADHQIGLILVIGKAAQPARPRGGQLPLSEIVVHNRF